MLRSLEHCVPRWALARITKRSCECGHKYARADIIQMGIRKAKKDNLTAECLAIEVMCPDCKKGTVTTFSQKKSFRQLLCLLLEELQKLDHIELARRYETNNSSRSKISEKEVADFKKILNKMKSHSEFLHELQIDYDPEIPDET